MIDPERVGGFVWTERTQGALTSAERRRLLGEIVRGQGAYIAGRIRLALGRTPAGAGDLAFADFRPPDSALAKEAEEAAREQTPGVTGHGYRSWAFGSALAVLDRDALEPEQFYVASLLHDHGIVEPVAGQDFTLRSAERARRCVREADGPEEAGDAIAQAITVHASPGADPRLDGPLGFYLQSGALMDLVGTRAEDLASAFRDDVNGAYPREGITAEITRLIKAEARAVPRGRFALLDRCGFRALVHAAPHRPR